MTRSDQKRNASLPTTRAPLVGAAAADESSAKRKPSWAEKAAVPKLLHQQLVPTAPRIMPRHEPAPLQRVRVNSPPQTLCKAAKGSGTQRHSRYLMWLVRDSLLE